MTKVICIDVSKYSYKDLEAVFAVLGSCSKLCSLSDDDKRAVNQFQIDVMEAAFDVKENNIRSNN